MLRDYLHCRSDVLHLGISAGATNPQRLDFNHDFYVITHAMHMGWLMIGSRNLNQETALSNDRGHSRRLRNLFDNGQGSGTAKFENGRPTRCLQIRQHPKKVRVGFGRCDDESESASSAKFPRSEILRQ